MKKRKSVVALTVLLLAIPVTTQAHNNYFLPGDAFFSVSITREVIEKWMTNKESEFEFSYSRFDGTFMACGNIGYTRINITDLDENFRSALSEAYWRYSSYEPPLFRLFGEYPGSMSQVNGVVALIYNADFGGPLGLKLNEEWQVQGAGKYGGLFDFSDPVIADWSLSPKYPPLSLQKPLEPLKHLQNSGEIHRTMNEKLTVSASRIRIVLVGFAEETGYGYQSCPNLRSIFKSEDGAEYIDVDAKGLTVSRCDNVGQWVEERKLMPVPEGDSSIPIKILK